MAKPLYDDPIVAKIHAIRAEMLANSGGDHRKLMAQVRVRENASDREVITAPSARMVKRSTEQGVGPDGE